MHFVWLFFFVSKKMGVCVWLCLCVVTSYFLHVDVTPLTSLYHLNIFRKTTLLLLLLLLLSTGVDDFVAFAWFIELCSIVECNKYMCMWVFRFNVCMYVGKCMCLSICGSGGKRKSSTIYLFPWWSKSTIWSGLFEASVVALHLNTLL